MCLLLSSMDYMNSIMTSLSIWYYKEIYTDTKASSFSSNYKSWHSIKQDFSLSICRGQLFRHLVLIRYIRIQRMHIAYIIIIAYMRRKEYCKNGDTIQKLNDGSRTLECGMSCNNTNSSVKLYLLLQLFSFSDDTFQIHMTRVEAHQKLQFVVSNQCKLLW